ncbi:hypothetical protein L313_2191 [Acinetobacter haemolyticus CIP 64.3 = MTCC 9819]|nr:hypothetical protein L313_2191 [Acinetobacter haemolyticus CIP 64.3 = MTCC 9819]
MHHGVICKCYAKQINQIKNNNLNKKIPILKFFNLKNLILI